MVSVRRRRKPSLPAWGGAGRPVEFRPQGGRGVESTFYAAPPVRATRRVFHQGMRDAMNDRAPGTPSIDDWQKAALKAAGSPARLVWHTPEGIAVKPLYTAADLAGLPYADTLPGFEPFVRGPQATMYAERPVDDPPVRRLLDRRGVERLLPAQPRRRADRACRSPSTSPPTAATTRDHPRVVGDVGKAGVAIDSVEDMKILFDGIPLDKMSVSMTMNGAVLPVLAGYIVAGGGAGRRAGPALGDDPERHPQGVHGPQHLHLPARAVDADRRRHHRVHGASTCRSSTRSRSPATTCRRPARPRCRSSRSRSPTASSTCARRWRAGIDVDDFAGRLSFFFAHRHELLHGGREAARGAAAVGADHEGSSTPKNPSSLMLRTHCQTSGVVAHRAGPVQQHRPHDDRGDGGGARRHAEPAHQLASTRRSRCRPTSRRASPATRSCILQEETGITQRRRPVGAAPT